MNKQVKLFSGLVLMTAATVANCGQVNEVRGFTKSLEQIKASISAGLQIAKPNLIVADVEKSVLPGLYKVTFDGAKEIYAAADGKHFISGDVFEVRPGEIVNLTDFDRNKDREKAISSLDKKDMITFSPKGEVKEVVYVFTDVDCGYCQLLHSKMPEYNAMGIEVRYLGYPRAGLQSGSYKKLASAWCADDPQDALTKVKLKQEIPENVCEKNPIAEQYNIGRQIGLTGTPALVLESGELISGYLDPDRMKQRLKL